MHETSSILAIIGGGMAAQRLVARLLASDFPRACRMRIAVFSAEPDFGYNRVLLSQLLSGEIERHELLSPSLEEEEAVDLYLADPVIAIDREHQIITTASGCSVQYVRAVIATGSTTHRVPFEGECINGIGEFRTLADADGLLADTTPGVPVCVIGGGFLGLEVAEGLRMQGANVTVIHRGKWPLNRQLDEEGGRQLADLLSERGLRFKLQHTVDAIASDSAGNLMSITLNNGEQLPAQRLVHATGIRPNIELARIAGLLCGRGIRVNDQLLTSDPHIYALGECIEHRGETFGLVDPIWRQVDVLLSQLMGEGKLFDAYPTASRLKISGIDLYAFGDPSRQEGDIWYRYRDTELGDYRAICLNDGHLRAGCLINDTRLGPLWYAHALAETNVDEGDYWLYEADMPSDTSPTIPNTHQDTRRSQTMNMAEDSSMAEEKQRPTIIVVGNGMVGHHCVERLIELNVHQSHRIIVFGDERHPAYDRVHLSEYFSGRDAVSLALCEADFYALNHVELHLGERIDHIERPEKCVVTASGSYHYDELVLATGSYPFVPPIDGSEGNARLVYRTLDDLDQIRAAGEGAKRGVVVGGGLLGLEAANALKSLGLEAHVVEFAPRLMPVQLDEQGGAALISRIEALGVGVHVSKMTQAIVPGEEGYRYRMAFADGESLDTDLVVFSAGIRPQDTLARACDLEIAERGGVVVNDRCQTSDPAIYAIGECASWKGSVFGLVAPGYRMAQLVADQLAGLPCELFSGADMSTKLKLLGVDVGSIGDAHATTPGARSVHFIDESSATYRRLILSEDGKSVLGAVLVGDNSYYDTLLQYVANRIEAPENPASLILPTTGDTPLLGADALPDTAVICSCNNVSKGAIRQAIDDGCLDFGALKANTKASTTCGGCAALVKQVFEAELSALGVEVDHSLCEHFSFTRQQLFDMVRIEKIQDFDTLMERHGNGGLGCDICKPTVASILASHWNRSITDSDLQPLQDTNDAFMANMQKDGTYSVVPRIAGGEITPEKLIALGEVAQKYDLYTKITGGQRIDMFGARLDQLPDIWEELIAAGFETGHAYGKSTRTVKSCVGNSWCRYGVQDSVAMALRLEHRYKGLRSPHKLKFGVSGCTRECAEAQGKDIGVIATEHGWNLYVCGNGGMRPRHAELFATDLDDETLIRYIDRLLMFYIRTADKLQRTSVWRENIEGGLEYIQEVVINDSLGLGVELEQQMERVVKSYEDEWAAALSNPEKLKRFRTFVNTEMTDPDLQYVRERGQRRPARVDVIPVVVEESL